MVPEYCEAPFQVLESIADNPATNGYCAGKMHKRYGESALKIAGAKPALSEDSDSLSNGDVCLSYGADLANDPRDQLHD